MDESTASLASAIGVRLKQERQSRGWTLDRLAEVAGVSRRMLINVEQGGANPSVGTLLRLGDALGIGLPSLVAPPEPYPVRLTPHGEGAVLWTGESGGRGVLVAGTEPPEVVELWDWTLEPGESRTSEAHAPGTRELLQVLAGALALTVADRSFVLTTGDASRFPGDVPHRYANHGEATVHFSLAVHQPGVGSGHRTETTDG